MSLVFLNTEDSANIFEVPRNQTVERQDRDLRKMLRLELPATAQARVFKLHCERALAQPVLNISDVAYRASKIRTLKAHAYKLRKVELKTMKQTESA